MSGVLGVKGTMPSFVYKLKLSIVTNGFTKFLEITDAGEQILNSESQDDEDREQQQSLKTFNVIHNSENEIEAKMSMVDLSI